MPHSDSLCEGYVFTHFGLKHLCRLLLQTFVDEWVNLRKSVIGHVKSQIRVSRC